MEAAQAGIPMHQYALVASIGCGRGVQANPAEAARLYGEAAGSPHSGGVEYAIRLFNGAGIAKDERRRGPLVRARGAAATRSRRDRLPASSPPAAGSRPTGSPAAKWHYLASSAGKFRRRARQILSGLTPEQRHSPPRRRSAGRRMTHGPIWFNRVDNSQLKST